MISKNKFLKNAQKVEVKQQMETGGILNKVDFIRQAQQAQRRQQDAFETYRAAVEEAKKTRNGAPVSGKVSEQEYSRSSGMQKQYGTYQNYLRGVEAAQGLKLGTLALQGQSALLAGRFAPATQQVRGDVDAFHAESQQKGRFGFGTGKELKEGQRGRGKVSEQEFNRSEAMVAQYGSYSNYLRGVYAGYDEAAAAGTKRRAEAALAEGKVSEAEFSRAPAMVEQYGTYRNYLNGVRKSDNEITRERAAKRIESLGISDTLEQYYNAEGEEQAQLRQQLADKGVTGTELNEWRNTVFNQAGQFIGDLAAGFFQGGLLQNMSGMEGALAGLENAANGTVAWALDDLSNPLPSGKLKTGIKSFANQLANADSRHEENARKLQEQNAQVMQQLTQGHSQAAKWIIEQMPSAGNMLLNVGTAGMAGVPNLAALGTTAGGNAYIEAKNDGATNEQALAYGIVNGSLEVLSEKLFGGNPLYDTDAGLVNQLVAKLTDNKTIMRILNSKGFDLLSEGLEEVVTEITEPWAQALIYAGKEAEFATLESVANAFAGGVFLSVVGNLADLPVSMRNREVQSVINDVTERVLYQAEQVADAGVQQAVADVREKMEYGEDVTAEDLGNVLNAMSEADAEVDAETVEAETAQAQEQAQAEADERNFQIFKSATEMAQENQRLAQQYQQEQEQNRAQQSVQAVQKAQQAAQQQYNQDSLFAPIPGTENMGELDPVQYAQRQTADAEQELDEAAAQQEEQYLQEQARRAGYDEMTAAYFLNGNTTGMPAEQYAQSFGQVYEQGRLGASEQRAMRYAEGMNQDVAAAAYRAGIAAGQKGVNNGSIEVTDEGQVGQAGQRAEGQAGGVRQSTAQQQRADAGRKRAQGARDLAKAWDEVELSTLGFGKDNTQKVRVMPKGQEARSEDIQAAEKFFRSMGVQNARFFTGQLTQEIDGQTFYADAAVTEDGSVLIRADSEEYSAFELAKHEGYHLLVKRWPEMAAKIQKRLLGEGKITKEMIESYVDAYAGIYGDDTDAYVEEIVADTYAGMNRTDYSTNKLRADVKMEVGQWQKKSGSERAPPAKMSASKAEKYDFTKPFAEQVDDWKAGKIGKNDTLVVGPTPEVFQKVGFNALPVTINQTHVDYALNGTKNEEHHIGESMLKQLPRAMKSPVAIIESETQRGTSVVALLPFIKDEKTVIIPVYVDGYGRQNSVVIDSNAVTSIYGRKNAVTGMLTNAIEKSNNGETTLFYVDKVKAAALYQVARVTMPKMPDTDNGFVASIRDEGSTVKPKLKNVTQSQQFKRWFGDWQNHPESASKVVNADGTPKVVYHGTSERNGSFTVFDESKAVKRGGLGFKALGKGNYFTATHLTGNERYGSRVIEAYLNIRNPLDVEAGTTFRDTAAEIIGESAHEMSYDELQAEMRERGYDGVIQRNKAGDINIAVAFDSNQIKSATENIGTFDKTNPDIRFSASARQASERDKQNLETVSAMLDDGSGRGVFKDAVFLRNPRLMQKLIDEREKTQTAAFQDWFADSKATNTTGEPLLVFHGAGAKFTKFDVGGKPIWLTANIKYAEEYSTATRSVERILPEASIYAGNVDRIIPAYIRVENPADVGNTDGGYSGNYMDLAKRLQIRPSELQAVWEQAGKPELMWQVINTPGMVEMLKRHGYDGIQAVENGVKAWAVFDSAQVKSAVANNGSFSLTNPDIRYSSQEGRYRDLMGEKAAQYVRRLESGLVNELAENLSVPGQAKREVLRPMAEEALRTFFTDGQLDRAKLNDLFETAYQAGIEEDTQYIEQYGDIKKFIRDQKISISETDRQDIADYNLFRKAAMGTLTISKDGLPVDVAYQQLQEMAPELFPADITAPSDQLMQIYDVARGIQKVQKTLDEYYGPQAASFKKWQQANFTESVDRLTSGLRVAQRYMDAQNKAKEKLAIPQTAEETKQMWAQLKDARRVVEKAQSKTLLTEADQKIVNRLLRGETSPDYVAGLENGQQILKVYEAKADYDMLALKLKAWNAQRKQGLRDFAEQALTEAEAVKWVDKNMGIRYQRETMERNIRDIARKGKVSDEKANAFINKYFWPVHENESKRKNYLVEQQDRIRALGLDRQVRKGNLVSESYAVQWLGEAEFNRDYLKQHPRVERRGGMTFNEWNAAIQEFEKQNPNMDLGKVRAAVKVFHEVYDKLFQDMNRVRIENGYEPVNYLQGYFPHFQENEEGGSILQKFARAAGIEGDVSPLPATINGLTANFKPGIRYMANIQNRLGYATAYDALQGFDRYIEVATDVIFHTADIQRLRALATQIRYRASDEGLKQRIDAIMMNPFLNPDEANEKVANLTKNGRYGLSSFVDELDEYTNLLAGKKSRLDRGMERFFNRKVYNVLKKFHSRVGANMVAANVGSALTNFIPIAQAAAQTGAWNMVVGMRATLKNYWNADGLSAASVFINNRSGYGRLAESTMDKVSEKAGILMEVVDGFTTGSVVRARYYQNLQRGMSEISAMQEADQFASGVMADRSKGSTPTLFAAQAPWVKLFTQFQLEVNNTLSWVFKDLYQEERKKGVLALCKAMLGWMLGSWILNEVYEALTGRRMGQDPFDIINDTVGDITGYQIPNTVDAMFSGEWDFTTQKEDTYGVAANLTQNLLGELPFTQVLTMLGLEVDNGRIAVASAIPDLGAVLKAATSKDIAPEKRGYTIRRELAKPAYYLLPPFGGGQARKLIQGGVAAWKGGSYSVDNEGRDILQYPVYNDNAEDRAKSWAQALLFGKTATEEAQSWVESGFKSLSAKETAAYQGMTEGGEDQRETYAFIQAARKLEKNYDKMMLLKAYDISDEAKAEYYYQVLAGDTQKAEMEPKSTQERIDYMNEKIQDAQDAKQKQDLKDAVAAGTVTQEKAIQKILANDYAEDENKAYWLYKEWTGGKDYTKYGKILQTIEDGGDLKAAAKEYFDHGAKKGDIGDAITTEYKPKYIAASPEERKKLKEKLLAAYTAVGFDRSKKSKDIDKWLKE